MTQTQPHNGRSGAVTKRYIKMLEVIDLAIDWMVNPPTYKVGVYGIKIDHTPHYNGVIFDAANFLGITEDGIAKSIIEECDAFGGIDGEDVKLNSLMKVREKLALTETL